MHKLGSWLLPIFLAGCAAAQSHPDASGPRQLPVSVCELDAHADRYFDKEVVATAQIVNLSPHGLYAYAQDCPEIYLIVYGAVEVNPDTNEQLFRHSGWPGANNAPIVTLRARLVLKDYELPGTTHVSKRAMLEVFQFLSSSPSP